MKIVIAIDSFKGCLTSLEIGNIVKEVIKERDTSLEVNVFPIADGGEGTLEVISHLLSSTIYTCTAHDPLMRPIRGEYAITSTNKTALIEMATVNGLPLLNKDERNPMIATTYGTGELIKDALERGCRNFIIGIGGSATNDAGIGMLQALGYKFYDRNNNEIGKGGRTLIDIAYWQSTNVDARLKDARFSIACDVTNPFFGANGAAYVYAKQKGASLQMIKELDDGLRSLSLCIEKQTGKQIAEIPGSGAAGGMGGGMIAFLDAELKSGATLLLELSNMEESIKHADLIITGEGKMDNQTLMGKIPGKVLEIGERNHVKVIGIAGIIENKNDLMEAGFSELYAITPADMSLTEALKPAIAKQNLRKSIGCLLDVYL